MYKRKALSVINDKRSSATTTVVVKRPAPIRSNIVTMNNIAASQPESTENQVVAIQQELEEIKTELQQVDFEKIERAITNALFLIEE